MYHRKSDEPGEMRTHRLKTGYIVRLRNGGHGMILRNTKAGHILLLFLDGVPNSSLSLSEQYNVRTLEYTGQIYAGKQSGWDITRVYAPTDFHRFMDTMNQDNLIWERDEAPKTHTLSLDGGPAVTVSQKSLGALKQLFTELEQ